LPGGLFALGELEAIRVEDGAGDCAYPRRSKPKPKPKLKAAAIVIVAVVSLGIVRGAVIAAVVL
jgi:hypothetical protein